ncbi:hypothetical protein ACQEU8_02380 [Streptomyces sp. CA-250714]|uniref:recombination directionality factor n=1 Tax=Streptomyces sp. CA-250714 TaxID=3240060 RepID=UPI003D91085A
MGLRIFDTDPDARPAPRSGYVKPEYAFVFKAGMMRGKKPVALDTWRVLTASPETAGAIQLLMGGSLAEEFDAEKEFHLHQFTASDSVEIVIDSVNDVDEKMILWGPRGPLHVCDGEFHVDTPGEEPGTPCGCPRLLKERQAKAKAGTGPSPNITVTFTLAHDTKLGVGKYVSTGWSLAKEIHLVKDALSRVNGPALCTLRLELVEYDSDKHGRVSYRKPVIDVQGSMNDAIAESR